MRKIFPSSTLASDLTQFTIHVTRAANKNFFEAMVISELRMVKIASPTNP
jgi:hypothetical protein